jgi:uncharacterized metal-binding protein YceD (DUF177 family)
MLKIHISNIQEGLHEYEFQVKPEDVDLNTDDEYPVLTGDVLVKTQMYKTSHQFDLKTQIKGKYKLQCDRCIDEFEQDFTNSFELIYKIDFTGKEDYPGEPEDEIKYIPPKTGFIDLKDDVRDYILLSVPMRHVPEEINGICTYCKRDISALFSNESKPELNPVWEKLIKAKTKTKK